IVRAPFQFDQLQIDVVQQFPRFAEELQQQILHVGEGVHAETAMATEAQSTICLEIFVTRSAARMGTTTAVIPAQAGIQCAVHARPQRRTYGCFIALLCASVSLWFSR